MLGMLTLGWLLFGCDIEFCNGCGKSYSWRSASGTASDDSIGRCDGDCMAGRHAAKQVLEEYCSKIV